MPAKVVDASVLGALIFGEPKAEEALRLLEETEIYAPSPLAYELASVAYKKARRHPKLQEKIFKALEVGLSLDINWTEVDYLEVLQLALEMGLTAYDATYLYLARSLGVPLLTFDARLAEKAK